VSRPLSFLLALVALTCAFGGIWFGGLRNEVAIGQTLAAFPKPNDTPFYRCADSFYWVSYAREMIEQGTARVRFTRMDNAPYGRPNYGWASLNAWYLIALAALWSVATGTTTGLALLPSALWSGPILYFLALIVLLVLGCWKRQFPSAVAAAIVLATSPRVYDDFAYAVPGHHGWHDLACFATLLLLAQAIGSARIPRLFIAAGIAGAVAIWIGVTQQAFGLAAAGAGALAGMAWSKFQKRSDETSAISDGDLMPAESWRVFGLVGAGTALSFYLLEYAPALLSFRLEVNHPIYALAFFLGGEFLCRAQRLLFTQIPRKSDRVLAAACAIGLAVIGAAIFLGPMEWHAMRQPFMRRLHEEIAEFQPITRSQGAASILVLGPPLFLVGLGFCRACRHCLTTRERTALLVTACPTLVAIILSLIQFRWAGIAGASAAALAAVLFAGPAPAHAAERRLSLPLWQACCILLSLGAAAGWNLLHESDNPAEVRAEAIDRLATMEVASVLQMDPKAARPITMFSGQKERQAWVDYTTGIRSVGSLYWDSPNGIRDEAEFLATYKEAEARRIARERGIDYIVVSTNPGDVIAYHYMWQGVRDVPQIRQTLAYRLAAPVPDPPSWLQLILVTAPAITREHLRIYRVL
jgi:hypothetical protein